MFVVVRSPVYKSFKTVQWWRTNECVKLEVCLIQLSRKLKCRESQQINKRVLTIVTVLWYLEVDNNVWAAWDNYNDYIISCMPFPQAWTADFFSHWRASFAWTAAPSCCSWDLIGCKGRYEWAVTPWNYHLATPLVGQGLHPVTPGEHDLSVDKCPLLPLLHLSCFCLTKVWKQTSILLFVGTLYLFSTTFWKPIVFTRLYLLDPCH